MPPSLDDLRNRFAPGAALVSAPPPLPLAAEAEATKIWFSTGFYAEGKVKTWKGYHIRVITIITPPALGARRDWIVQAHWGAINDISECLDASKMKHNSKSYHRSKAEAMRTAHTMRNKRLRRDYLELGIAWVLM